jgi:pathogenesis-related protein 1
LTAVRHASILVIMAISKVMVAIALTTAACNSGTSGGGGSDGGRGTVDSSHTSTADASGGVGEPTDLTGITLYHNQARQIVGVPALVWDPALATIASNWVQMCEDTNGDGLVDHNANRSATYPTYVGENIYASTGTATAMDAVSDWVSEQQYYNHANNTCAVGQECGHYTQVVWSTTMKVGCALYDCTSLRYPSTIVCDYGPGGNIDGQSPY